MGEIATWRDRQWLVSSRTLRPLQALATARSLDREINTGNEGSQQVNVRGYALQSVICEYLVSVAAGTHPRKEYEHWKALVGQKAPLHVGRRRLGPTRLQLQEVTMESENLSDDGGILSATISLTFMQDSTGSGTTSSAQEGTASSALNVGPSWTEKTLKLGGGS